jgi:hypothetical protein
MRVAVCVSGAFKTGNPKGSLTKNNDVLKAKFPNADFYYATWDSYKPEFEKVFPNEKCEYFPEPHIHYHPYMDIETSDYISNHYNDTVAWVKKGGAERLQWTSHHTKQILIHALLIDKIKKDYDIIVRMRFDGYISKTAEFTPYLEDTFTNHRANCFGATRKERFAQLVECDKANNSLHNNWILDQLIIHNADAIDVDNVMRLHEEKKLHSAEYGWYQVISMPYNSNHRNFSGWVNHDKNVLDKFLFEETQ